MTTHTTDYQADMQAAALRFMQRHQAEHLGEGQLLFTRALGYLTTSLGVSQALAEKLVTRAWGELTSANQPYRLDLEHSSEHTVAIVDPASGMTLAVPVALIAQHLIDTPKRRRLTAVS